MKYTAELNKAKLIPRGGIQILSKTDLSTGMMALGEFVVDNLARYALGFLSRFFAGQFGL